MTIATEVPVDRQLRLSVFIAPFRWIGLHVSRVLWHTKAYSVILGITVLVLLSLLFLQLEQLIRPSKSAPQKMTSSSVNS